MNMLKKLVAIFLVTSFLCVSIVTTSSVSKAFAKDVDKEKASQKKDSLDGYYKQLELLTDALSIIKNEYVDEKQPKDLVYGSLKGLLKSLDSHSQFMEPKLYGDMKVDTSGKFGGLGIELTIRDKILTIVAVIEDSPAYGAELESKDRIIKIDGEITEDFSLMKAVEKLRGKPGSTVKLTIYRESESRLFDVEIKRKIIQIESIKSPQILEDSIAYVRITEFQEQTAKDLQKVLKKLNDEKMFALIVDVRNNPGGLLDVAVDVTEIFLPEDKLIVYTKGRVKEQNIRFFSQPGKKYLTIPLIVLVDGGSASGSEIFAGAMQDYGRGILIGEKTFGKGSVQTVIPLSDGSAIRLTTSKYFTPNGRTIHNNGIVPDITVKKERKKVEKEKVSESEDKLKKIMKKFKKNDKKVTKNKIEYDAQVVRAIDLIKALRVYNIQLGKGNGSQN